MDAIHRQRRNVGNFMKMDEGELCYHLKSLISYIFQIPFTIQLLASIGNHHFSLGAFPLFRFLPVSGAVSDPCQHFRPTPHAPPPSLSHIILLFAHIDNIRWLWNKPTIHKFTYYKKKTLFLARYGNTAFDYSDSFIVDPDWSKGSFHHG